MKSEPIVFVLAGDSATRRRMAGWLLPLQLSAAPCRSEEEFFDAYLPGTPGCLVLDVTPPLAGLDLLHRLGPRDTHLPVIAVSGKADVDTAVQCMKLGAWDFIFHDSVERRLPEAVRSALCWEAENRRRISRAEATRRRIAQLKPGERLVLDLLMAGDSNPEIAEELGLSVRSIEVRRAKVMRVLRARSIVDLVRRVLSARGDR